MSACALTIALAACGQKGPLFLPTQQGPAAKAGAHAASAPAAVAPSPAASTPPASR